MSQAFQTLVISQRGAGVAQITMSRPQVFNAFDEVMIGELDAAFTQLSQDDAVRVIVLAGEGKHFSAGADLQWMQRASEASLEWNTADARRFAAMLHRIATCPKPTVARVQGAAVGVIGTFSGLALGLLVAFNIDVIVPALEKLFNASFLPRDIYLISRMPSEPLASDILPVAIISLVLAFVATLYPSWRASQVNPAEALRYE